MARRKSLSGNQKRQVKTVVLAVLAVFLAAVVIIPLLKVDPVALDATPTAWQNVHKFFTDTRQFIADNGVLLAIIGGVGFLSFKYLK